MEYLDYVFAINGPFKGQGVRISRDDGPIPGFKYKVNGVWVNDEDLVPLPEGFVPWYDQGNVQPV